MNADVTLTAWAARLIPGVLLALLLGVLLLSVTRAQSGEDNAELQVGEEIYHTVCAACHMHDGRGAEGAGAYPALVDNGTVAASADFVILRVLNGFGAMPPFGGTYNDEQVAAVTNYVRATFTDADDVVTAERVAELR